MIKFKNVGKKYPNGVEALKHVNLEIKQGEFIAIIGLSGAGKSTLIRLINKMIDTTYGRLIVNDTVVDATLKGKKLRTFRRNIGMVFQGFNLVNRISVLNNVLSAKAAEKGFFSTLFGVYTPEDKIEALAALDKVGILDKAYIRADQLSGGQMQRVALSRTLAQKPSIILADEPVASLDPITANMIMSDFKKINKELNMTIITNMHHVDLALNYVDRVIGIHAGEVVYDGPAKNVTDEILRSIYQRELTAEDKMFKHIEEAA